MPEMSTRRRRRAGLSAVAMRGMPLTIQTARCGSTSAAFPPFAVLTGQSVSTIPRSMLHKLAPEGAMNILITHLYVRLAHREDGQTMAEYAIVLAVISIAIIGAIGLLGTNIKTALSTVASKV